MDDRRGTLLHPNLANEISNFGACLFARNNMTVSAVLKASIKAEITADNRSVKLFSF